jgi:hypothetical protein
MRYTKPMIQSTAKATAVILGSEEGAKQQNLFDSSISATVAGYQADE